MNINFTSKTERRGNRNIILHTSVSSSGKVYGQAEITSYLSGISVSQKYYSIIFICKAVGVLLVLNSEREGIDSPPG